MRVYALLSALLLLCGFVRGQGADRLLLGGSGWNKIAIVDKATKKIVWEHPLEKGWECNSVAATPEGDILFSYARGAKLIDREHREIWRVEVPDGCEMQTARRLPDGNFLLAWCGHPSVILEVNARGEEVSRTAYETGIEQPHAQFRQVSKNTRGNYLLPLFATSEIREVSPAGELVKRIPVEGTPFCALGLPNGNYLVACGDAHSFVELDCERGEVVRRVGANDIAGARLFFVAQLYPAAEGGLYICNWQGHDSKAGGHDPQLIEIDQTGKIVWSLNDNATFGMISSVCPIDEK